MSGNFNFPNGEGDKHVCEVKYLEKVNVWKSHKKSGG